ncbi:unnamed protein product, partial [Didymodactylos carnosus]
MNHLFFSERSALLCTPTARQRFCYERCATITRRKEFRDREQRQIKEKLEDLKERNESINQERRRIVRQQHQQKWDREESYVTMFQNLCQNYNGKRLTSEQAKLYKRMCFDQLDETEFEEKLEKNKQKLQNNDREQHILRGRIRPHCWDVSGNCRKCEIENTGGNYNSNDEPTSRENGEVDPWCDEDA